MFPMGPSTRNRRRNMYDWRPTKDQLGSVVSYIWYCSDIGKYSPRVLKMTFLIWWKKP